MNESFQAVWDEAAAAGRAAGEACVPQPVVFGQAVDLFSSAMVPGTEHVALEGLCGFAWVDIYEPKNSPFCKFLLARNLARRRYEGKGVHISVSDYNQSIARKEAHADAVAVVLRAHGIKAYSGSRLD